MDRPDLSPLPPDHTALMEELNGLSKAHPSLDLSYIGTSVLGRGIPVLSLGTGRSSVLYVGAHHGMEWLTSLLLCRFAGELCTLAETGGRVGRQYPATILEMRRIYIIPMLNPDGVEYQLHGVGEDNPLRERLLEMNDGSTDFSHWQANGRGVDLNHNYDAGFAAYKTLEAEMGITGGAPTRYSGECPESEPESERLATFIRFHEELRGVMTLHTQGEEIFTQCVGARARDIRHIADRLSALSGYRVKRAEGPAAFGGLSDWCIQKRGLPAFTVECGRGVNPLPASMAEGIYRDIREMLFAFPTLV